MDSALNKNAGIFVRSIYQPFLAKRNKERDDKKLMGISKLVSFISGLGVIVAALYFASLEKLSLFELMMSVSTMVQVPMMVPLALMATKPIVCAIWPQGSVCQKQQLQHFHPLRSLLHLRLPLRLRLPHHLPQQQRIPPDVL